MTGVVTKPMAGAKEEGAAGFFKGFGKGFIGLVARPTGGVVDFATTSFDIVKRYVVSIVSNTCASWRGLALVVELRNRKRSCVAFAIRVTSRTIV